MPPWMMLFMPALFSRDRVLNRHLIKFSSKIIGVKYPPCDYAEIFVATICSSRWIASQLLEMMAKAVL